MKKCLCIVTLVTLMLPLCTSLSLSNPNTFFTLPPCASTCANLSPSTDCGNVIYEIDDFPGTSTNSTTAGNASGLGCQYFGYASPVQLGSGTGSSYTLCTEYTASSIESSYIVYLNAGNFNCIQRSVAVYDAGTCSPAAGVSITQPVATLPGIATNLVPGNDYVVCHTYTESGCGGGSASNIYEVCMSIVEASYCSSSPDPRALTEACSSESFQIPLDNLCVTDPDFNDFAGGLSGFAVFYYVDQQGRYTNFPQNMTAFNLQGNPNIRFYDESNVSSGGGCSPISMNSIINTDCAPIDIPVGIVGIDVNSIGTAFLNIISDCKVVNANVRIHPQLTSQVTGSTVQLLSPNGAVCETYSTTGGNGGTVTLTPTSASGIVSIGGFQLNVNGTYGNIGTLPTPPGKTPVTNTGGGGTNAPCVTAGTAGNRNYDDNTGFNGIPHTIEVNNDGDYVITYEEQSISNLPVVYPNPAQNQLFFNAGQNKPYTVDIYDTFGKQVFRGQTIDGQPLDIAHLPSGLYTYALNNEEQTLLKHGKWVKQ